ncbi:Os10g0161475 [Oryza sativa Japonica Group]|uniref:Os10g0161475 protein n=1 Tax=Oryza sativa subsp. japonica TaxID=39947 RepID=A0A0P0XRX8_ORYSJ|nr:Os10g0161475 [Oryza sativa Japonica Group]
MSAAATACRLAAAEEGEPSATVVEDVRTRLDVRGHAHVVCTDGGRRPRRAPVSLTMEPWKEEGEPSAVASLTSTSLCSAATTAFNRPTTASLPPRPSTDNADGSADLGESCGCS